jgi:hypothetical protein
MAQSVEKQIVILNQGNPWFSITTTKINVLKVIRSQTWTCEETKLDIFRFIRTSSRLHKNWFYKLHFTVLLTVFVVLFFDIRSYIRPRTNESLIFIMAMYHLEFTPKFCVKYHKVYSCFLPSGAFECYGLRRKCWGVISGPTPISASMTAVLQGGHLPVQTLSISFTLLPLTNIILHIWFLFS